MKIGTKSLLFGVHQFLWHPFTVLLAWVYLFGLPNWKELVCIFIHDWGYWGCEEMDGKWGCLHPRWAADKAMKWFGPQYYVLCLYHSRSYAERHKIKPSRLCWADKFSICFDPSWFYLLRARLSGEIIEYRSPKFKNDLPKNTPDKTWFKWLRYEFKKQVKEVGVIPKRMKKKYDLLYWLPESCRYL